MEPPETPLARQSRLRPRWLAQGGRVQGLRTVFQHPPADDDAANASAMKALGCHHLVKDEGAFA